MQDMWCGCTMLEKGAFERCYAWYAINVHPSSDALGALYHIWQPVTSISEILSWCPTYIHES
jgi:hypothetical protein